jgi:hypothetical protein
MAAFCPTYCGRSPRSKVQAAVGLRADRTALGLRSITGRPASIRPKPKYRERRCKTIIRIAPRTTMTANSTVLFSVARTRDDDATEIVPLIDGVALTCLVESFERQQSFAPAGGYGGLIPEFFAYGPLDRYFLGDAAPNTYWEKLGGVYLLGCECGEVGCWPLRCQIRKTDEYVKWDKFTQPFRAERDYSAFGPFVFDAAQYLDALAGLQLDLQQTSRPPGTR